MAAYWGVDSLNPASTKLHVKGSPTLFEYVCNQAGRVPAFWGRYITALTFTKNGKKIKFPKLEKSEVEFIFNKSNGATRILPIYNLAWPGPTSLKGGASQGETTLVKPSAQPKRSASAPVCFYGATLSPAGRPHRPGIPAGGRSC